MGPPPPKKKQQKEVGTTAGTEPVFVNVQKAQKSIPRSRSANLYSLPGRTSNRVVALARQAGNRCLGSLKGLQIRAQAACRLVTMEISNLKDQLGPGKQRAETLFALEKEESQKNYHCQSLLTVPPFILIFLYVSLKSLHSAVLCKLKIMRIEHNLAPSL